MPFTSPHGVRLVNGLPVAEVSTSGYTAQPCAGSNVNAPAPAGSVSTRRPAATPSALFCEGRTIVNAPPAALSTRQSASGPAPFAGATAPSRPAAMKSRSRP